MCKNKNFFEQVKATASGEVATLSENEVREKLAAEAKAEVEKLDTIERIELYVRYQEMRAKSAAERIAEAEKELQAVLEKNAEDDHEIARIKCKLRHEEKRAKSAAACKAEAEKRLLAMKQGKAIPDPRKFAAAAKAAEAKAAAENTKEAESKAKAAAAQAAEASKDFENIARDIVCAVLRAAIRGGRSINAKNIEKKSPQKRWDEARGTGWLWLVKNYRGILIDKFFGLEYSPHDIISEGYSLISEAKIGLLEALDAHYKARGKDTPAYLLGDSTLENTKTGEPLSFFGAACRAVNRAITREKRATIKNKTFEVYDEAANEYYAIPKFFEVESVDDLKLIEAARQAVKMSDLETRIFNGRMKGFSLADIAKSTASSYDTIRGVAARLRKKFAAAGISPEALKSGGGKFEALSKAYE